MESIQRQIANIGQAKIPEWYIGHRDGDSWIPRPSAPDVVDIPPVNCRNCAAPHDGYSCEYCGTVYIKRKVVGVPEPTLPKKPRTRKISFWEMVIGVCLGLFIFPFILRLKSQTPTPPPTA